MNINLKMLVYQPTNQVVWYFRVPIGGGVVWYLPKLDYQLDYKSYYGPEITSFDVFKAYNNYSLIKPDGLGTMSVRAPTDHEIEILKLLRARCCAMSMAWNILKYQYENHNLLTGPWHDVTDLNVMSDVYQRHYAIDAAAAMRLVEFIKEEKTQLVNRLSAQKLDAELRLTKAKTIDEINEQFAIINAHNILHTDFDVRTVI